MQKVLGLDLSKVTMPEAIAAMVEAWLDAQAADEECDSLSHQKPLTGIRHLSDKEVAVLQEVADGASNESAGERLQLSMETVKTHMSHVTAKLQARNRANAVAVAIRAGIIR